MKRYFTAKLYPCNHIDRSDLKVDSSGGRSSKQYCAKGGENGLENALSHYGVAPARRGANAGELARLLMWPQTPFDWQTAD
jgi:hypothetical protein